MDYLKKKIVNTYFRFADLFFLVKIYFKDLRAGVLCCFYFFLKLYIETKRIFKNVALKFSH